MKNKKLLAVLATIALAAPAMTGCLKKGNSSAQPASVAESSEGSSLSSEVPSSVSSEASIPSSSIPASTSEPVSSSSEVVPPVTRVSVKNTPDYWIEGQEYDFDEFVQVVGGRGPADYTLEVKTEATAYVAPDKPHKVTILAEGEVKINILAGSLEKHLYDIPAISAIVAQYREAIAEVGCSYTAYEFNEEGELDMYMQHNPNYAFGPTLMGINHPAGKTDDDLQGGGIIKLRNDNAYLYNVYKTNNLILGEKLQYPMNLYFVCGDYDLEAGYFTTEYDYKTPDGDYVDALYMKVPTSTIDMDNSFAFQGNFLDEFTISKVKYVPYEVWMYPYVTTSGKEVWEMDIRLAKKTTPTLGTTNKVSVAFSFDADDCTNDFLEDYIANGPLPEAVKFDELPTAFDKLITAKNYTINTEVTICPSSGAKDKNNETTEFDIGKYYLESKMASTTRVTANGYYTTSEGMENFVSAENDVYYRDEMLFAKGGAVYSTEKDAEGNFQTPAAIDGATDLWDLAATVAGMGSEGTIYDAFEASSNETDAQGNVVISALGADSEAFGNRMFRFEHVGQHVLGNLQYHVEQGNLDSLFQSYSVKVIIGTDTIDVEYSTSWLKSEAGVSYTAYIDFVFTNIGTTTIPELDSYLAD